MNYLSHISFSVSDFQKSLKFYDAILGALGLKRVYTGADGAGWGISVGDEIFEIKKRVEKISPPNSGFHLAFHASNQEEVHKFHTEALKNGGFNNGLPGPRPQYGNDYYAAFVIDPDGYELEVKLKV
jgi:catechol 2,3-dioxygenase-like lactoylglutathione lyase family enzyme